VREEGLVYKLPGSPRRERLVERVSFGAKQTSEGCCDEQTTQLMSPDGSNKVKKSKPDIAVRNRNYHTATGNHMPYEITKCYLPPGRGDFPAFTPAEAGTRFSDPGGMQG